MNQVHFHRSGPEPLSCKSMRCGFLRVHGISLLWAPTTSWGASALGTWVGTAVLGSLHLSCPSPSCAFVKNIHFSLSFGCKILSYFSSELESVLQLLDLGTSLINLVITILCAFNKHSRFSWASLVFAVFPLMLFLLSIYSFKMFLCRVKCSCHSSLFL